MEKIVEIEEIKLEKIKEKTKSWDKDIDDDATRCMSPRGCLPQHEEKQELELEVLEIT